MSIIIKSGNSENLATVNPDGSLATSSITLDQSVSGIISVIDSIVPAPANDGQMVSGASNPAALIALNVEGVSSWTIAITGGVFTTTLYFEGSLDSTTGVDGNWASLFGRVIGNSGDENEHFTATNNQLIQGSCGGLKFLRIRAVGGTITTPPTIRVRAGTVNTISIGTPLPTGDNVIGHVVVDSGAISGSVTAVQPSGSALHVDVDNFPATQPVSISGTVPISAFSLPLPTGASTSSLQTTGNSSLSSIDTKTPTLVGGRQPVDGSGVTQPISGSVSFTAPQHVIVDTAPTTAVTGTFFQATQPVSAASLPLPTGASTDVSLTNGTSKTQTVSGTGTIQDVNAKAVQGANFSAVQQPKDSGRVFKVYTAQFSATAAEAMITLTPVSDGTAGSTGTTFSITATKRFRIQAIALTLFNTTAAIRGCQINLRVSASGAVTTATPIVGTCGASTAAATTGLSASALVAGIPDGLELSGTMQLGISQIGIALAGQTVTLIGYEY